MRKRFILLGLTLGIIGAVFLVYYLSTRHLSEMAEPAEPADTVSRPESGEDVSIINVAPIPGENLPGEVGIGNAEKFHYVHREKGRTLSEFGFERRLGSEEKNLLVSKPWVKFHTSEHRVIHICAKRGRIPMESPGGQIQLPQSGSLEEEVRVAVYESPSGESAADPELTAEMMQNAQLLVELEQVEFEGEFSRLQSEAAVKVRSPYFQADGSRLRLQYDPVHEVLQELQLAQVDQLRVRSRLLRSSGKSAEQPAQNRSAAAAGKEKKSALAAYRLVLQDEVMIEQPREKLTADRMEVVTVFDYQDWMKETRSESKKATEEKEKTDVSAGAAAAAEDAEETVIRCKGGLTILHTEVPAELAAGQIQLSAFGSPVRIYRNGEVAVESALLSYNSRTDRIALVGSENQVVRVALAPQQWATAKHQVELDQAAGLATLTGPGQIEYRNESNQRVSIDYQDQLMVKSAQHPSLEEVSSAPPSPQRLEFTGRLEARTDGQNIQADKGILTFFPPDMVTDESVKTSESPAPSIRSIDLQGSVSAAGPDRSFSADSLIATFTRSQQGGSVLESFLAQRNVEVDDPEYRIEASETLDLKFDSSRDVAEESSALKPKEIRGLGLEQLINSMPLWYARATGPGGTVSLTDKNNGYEIQGDRVEGDASENQWTIVGSPAVIRMAGQGAIEGSRITINQKTGLCEVAGKGTADFLSEADLTGQKREQPIPVRIAWNNGAVYEINGRQIRFRDVTVEAEQKSSESVEKSRLRCPELLAVLSIREAEKTNEVQNPFGGSDLASLEAAGPLVELTHEQYDAGGQILQNLLNMQASRMLFDNTRRILYADGEGWIEYKQFTAESAASRGSLSQSLGSFMNPQGASYSLLRFGRQMTLNQNDNTLFFDGPVALDHLPAAETITRDATGTTTAEGLRRLDCRQLLIAADGLLEPKRQTDSTENADVQELLAIASLSGRQPAEVLKTPAASVSSARGGVIFEAIQNQKRFAVSGRTWVYDSAKQYAVIQGDASLPVTMTAAESLPVNLMQCREIQLQIKPEGISFKAFPLE